MKPIIFSTDMVKSILEGQKSQTRRVITRMNSNVNGSGRASKEYWEHYDFNDAFVDPGPSPAGNPGPYLKVFNSYCDARDRIYPIWFPKDDLWVRETHQVTSIDKIKTNRYCVEITYKANGDCHRIYFDYSPPEIKISEKWRPSIHMPKWASRINLEIKDVRVERVQDISVRDILFEGIDSDNPEEIEFIENSPNEWWGWGIDEYKDEYRQKFIELWNSINEKRGYGWDVNPWVWVVEFEVI